MTSCPSSPSPSSPSSPSFSAPYDWLDWTTFNVFEFDRSTAHHPLRVLTLDLITRFKLSHLVDTHALTLFLDEIERLYTIQHNPYHTSVHAADVVATVGTMLLLDGDRLFEVFRDWELLSLVVACVGHDVGHQGVTNGYHARLKTAWWRKYGGERGKEQSINELAHADITLGLIRDDTYDFLKGMEVERRKKVLEYVERMILQTDITWHEDVCDRFGRACRKEAGEWSEEDRIRILSGLLHFADVSNPGRPWGLCKRWGELIWEEQRGEERRLLPQISCREEDGGRHVANSDARGTERRERKEGELEELLLNSTQMTLASCQIAFIQSRIQPFCAQVSLVSPVFAALVVPYLAESVKAWQREAETLTVSEALDM